ncbi:MAG: fibronectin type III domain-containing protein, partial [Nitrospirae bacterium]
YIIERKKTDVGAFAEAGRVGSGVTEFVDTGLQENGEFHYRVRAYNGTFGNSDPSGEVVILIGSSGSVGSTGGGGGGGCSITDVEVHGDGSLLILLVGALIIKAVLKVRYR